MIPPEIKPVKVDETDYRRKISDVQQKMMKVRAYQDYLKTLADVKELAHQWYLEDIFVKALSDDGPIVRCLIEDYRQLLTEAVNGISSTTGIQVIFTNDNGLDMLFKTKGTEFRPYTSLSAGEQVLAYITVSDMLSRLSGYHLIVLDDMDKLDNENLDCVVHLLSDNISGYENVLLAGVNHEGTDSILNKYHVVTL
jgi:hypothetical protein